MRIQRGIVYNMHIFFPQIKSNSVKFTYVISKLLNITEDEYEAIKEAIKPADKFLEYQTKYNTLIQQYNNESDSDKKKSIEQLIIQLNEEYKEVIEERKRQIAEAEELLRQEIEIDLTNIPKLTIDEIPSDIPIEAMRILDKLNLIVF